VRSEFDGWGLGFSDNLVQVNSRVMPQEKVYQRGNVEASHFMICTKMPKIMIMKSKNHSDHLQKENLALIVV
jgi:hypothetical protein